MKIIAPIIVRMGSHRIPGKAMFPLGGKTAFEHCVERLQTLKWVDEVALFTTDADTDNVLARLGQSIGIPVYRGSQSPIERTVAGLEWLGADIYLHGAAVDNPLFWTQWAKGLTDALIERDADYACWNNLAGRKTVASINHFLNPYSMRGIRRILEGARAAGGRYFDHVNLWMLHNPERFRFAFLEPPPEALAWKPYCLKLDTAEDCVVVSRVFAALYRGEPLDTWDAIRYLDANPELARMNANYKTLDNPWYAEMNYEEGWVARAWRNQMAKVKAPEGATPFWCSSGSCYLGWADMGLHLLDGSILQGPAELACSCGAGARWD